MGTVDQDRNTEEPSVQKVFCADFVPDFTCSESITVRIVMLVLYLCAVYIFSGFSENKNEDFSTAHLFLV